MANGNGGKQPHPFSQIAISATIALGIALITAFWSLADPRADIKSIKDGYLSIREHDEFKSRVERTLAELAAQNLNQNQVFMSKAEFERWKGERDVYIRLIQREIEEVQKQKVNNELLKAQIERLEQELGIVTKRQDDAYQLLQNYVLGKLTK
jgi:hypothetical protein